MKKENLFIILGILIVMLFLDFNSIGIPCFFYKITNLYCPGCGITRALKSLAKLDFYQAIRYNVLVISLIPFFVYSFVANYIFHKNFKYPNICWYVLLVITILFGILRNIPYFSWLAPINI